MAKKKSKKIEKETRLLIESISDVLKKKGDRYKFKTGKKKVVRKMKRSCPHWIIRKGKEDPTLQNITKTVLVLDDGLLDKETRAAIQDLLDSGVITNQSTVDTLTRLLTKGSISVPYWQCRICGAEFPINPGTKEEREAVIQHFTSLINQIQFWSVKLGGDSNDTRLLLKLKELVPMFAKLQRQVIKQVDKREKYEKNKSKSDLNSQFDGYTTYTYH